jgi:hypothetical protein
MDLFVKNLQLGFRITVRVKEVKAGLKFASKGPFEEFFHSAKRNRAVCIDGIESGDGGPDLGEKGADVVCFLGGAGLADLDAVLEVCVGLDMDTSEFGACPQDIRHAANRGCDGKSRHGHRVKHWNASLG